jgi:large subunit ribosomal protein L10
MALKLEDKQAIVTEVAGIASKALSAAAADYRGLTVGEMNKLRAKAREQGVYTRVVRNTLARRAVIGTEFECMSEELTGSLILAFGQKDPGSVGRLFRDFSKEHEKFEVKMLALGGKVMGPDQLEAIAKLPTKEEALASLMAVMKAPISKFVRTLNEPHAKFVRTVAAVRDQKQAQA